MRFQIPANLRLNMLIDEHPTQSIKGFSIDKVHYVCNSIIGLMCRLDNNDRYPGVRFPYYVPLNAEILKKVIGIHYKDIVKWMENTGIIEVDDSYIPGTRSKLYRFTDVYNQGKYRWVNATTYAFQKRSYSEGHTKHEGKYIYETNLIKRLNRFFNDELTFDKERALSHIKKLYDQEYQEILSGHKKARQRRLIRLRIKHNSYQLMIERVANGANYIHQDPYGHRLHTSITGLKRELRPYIHYQGSVLAEIDLSNSQLFFILPLLDWRNWVAKKERRGKLSLNSSIWVGIEHLSTNNNIIMLLKSLESTYGKGLQNVRFAHDACKGIVYESIVEELDKDDYFDKSDTKKVKRDKVKKALLSLLFACPKRDAKMYNSRIGRIWTAFKSIYPEVGLVIEMIKEDDYHYMSMLLQRVESFCMIRGVVKAVVKNHSDIPLFTLHDCIVTTPDHIDTVEKVLLAVITDIVGCTPTVKRKDWHPRENGATRLKRAIDRFWHAIRKRAA